jgi:hypothetical protein
MPLLSNVERRLVGSGRVHAAPGGTQADGDEFLARDAIRDEISP